MWLWQSLLLPLAHANSLASAKRKRYHWRAFNSEFTVTKSERSGLLDSDSGIVFSGGVEAYTVSGSEKAPTIHCVTSQRQISHTRILNKRGQNFIR